MGNVLQALKVSGVYNSPDICNYTTDAVYVANWLSFWFANKEVVNVYATILLRYVASSP